ncbi:hypothetical protein PV04_07527 [Phialophora macrospora]|uniref:Uncharacterized protein n=1 Tax=Phialophora macrospora TaxID=1851006 RepID=A0A0D2FB59_9EURO|nr:hypothetical protein PV04_07527 [Phialophora macrospora]
MAPETRTHGDYTVGWVCALPKEQTAATAMLDKIHGNLPKPPHDSNTYTLGSIGQHNVVIACLPKGKYGTNSAAHVATLMVGTFPSIKVGLMVGIGGGIPPKVRLGDVVVGTPGGQFSGVVQWDMGKAKAGGKFERTGALNNPPNALLSALAKLETEHDLSGSKIPEYLEELKHKYPRAAKKYLKHDSMQDVLFRADYDHVNEASVEDDASIENNDGNDKEEEEDNDDGSDDDEEESCRLCDKTKIVRRKRRGMRVHYGLVASGNQVIKDAAFRDKLNKDLGGDVLCVEMEAAGLMNSFPCLVIRGTCDYADSHKNKAWQEHAAAVAAAFAKELLCFVQASDVEGEPPVKDILNDEVEPMLIHAIDKELAEQKAILNWLSQIDFAPQQHDYISRCEPGTGQLLLQSTEYQTWLKTSKQTLFCPGIPGAGKTMQTSILVHDLVSRFRDDTTVGIAYIYCNFQRQQDQRAEYLLASLTKQLAQSQKPFPSSVQALYNRHQKRSTRPLLEELSATLQSVGKSYSRVFIIIDALDECDDTNGSRTKLLDHLFSAQSEVELKILATSRFIPDISKRFEDYPCKEIYPTDEDIFRFLGSQMRELPDFVTSDVALQDDIKKKIASAIEGMFLLAPLYIDSLVGERSPAALRAALESLRNASAVLPDGSSALDEAYTKAMERIRHQQGHRLRDALLALSWVVNARRQLTVPELLNALAVEIGKSALDEDNIPTIGYITTACAPLITVDAESNIVRLVHYTTQEYFERKKNDWFENAQIDITRICITYLSFSAFESGFCPSEAEFEDRLEANKLYDYAAQNWAHHASVALALGLDTQEVVDFLEDERKLEAWSQALMISQYELSRMSSQLVPMQLTALHLAGYFGIYDVAVALLERGHDPNNMDSRGLTPLWWAARNGHAPVVKLLLERNVDPDPSIHSDYQTPLWWAAENGHTPILVKLLLEKDVDLESKHGFGFTPLTAAALNGHTAVVKLLLAKDVNLEAKNAAGMTPLAWAAMNGHPTVIESLLAKDADLEAKNNDGMTPLAWAARNGHPTVIESLLAKDANLEAKNNDSMTPLAWAARNGHPTVIESLLAKDAYLEAKNYYSMTPLAWAARNGHPTVIELLLAKDADLEAKDYYGLTPLAWAARNGHPTVIESLLAKHVDLEAKDNYGLTPLAWAAIVGHKEVTKLLLDRKADVNAQDNAGTTALHWATWGGHDEVVSLLLQSRADTEIKNVGGGTALAAAVEKGSETIIKLLLSNAATLNDLYDLYTDALRLYTREEEATYLVTQEFVRELASRGQVSPLWLAAERNDNSAMKLLQDHFKDDGDLITQFLLLWAAKTGHEGVARLLLERGDYPNAKDASGANAFLLAAMNGCDAVVSLLLTLEKVDVDMKDEVGRTALSFAAENGYSDIVAMLLASGRVDPDSKDIDGRTPLSYAAAKPQYYSHDSIVELLIATSQVNPDSKDKMGRTPLSYASEYDNPTAAEDLIRSDRVDPDSKDIYGRTPLSYACSGDLATILLASGRVNPDSKDIDGRTPLSYARSGGLARILLASGRVEIESRDKSGRTPLSHAAGDGRLEVVELLLEKGAIGDLEDKFGQTPLRRAREGRAAFKNRKGNEDTGEYPSRTVQYARILELLTPPHAPITQPASSSSDVPD